MSNKQRRWPVIEDLDAEEREAFEDFLAVKCQSMKTERKATIRMTTNALSAISSAIKTKQRLRSTGKECLPIENAQLELLAFTKSFSNY